MTNEMHNSYNKFLFHNFLFALHVSNESNRSSSEAKGCTECNDCNMMHGTHNVKLSQYFLPLKVLHLLQFHIINSGSIKA